MSAITQSYKIDMTSGAVPLRIKVSQYDAGIRQLTFWLYNLGTKLTSSQLSSLTAYVQGTKEDQKGFEYECTAGFSSEGCYVDVDITEQMTACAGDVICELVLTAEDVRIGSANFVLEVEKAALGADTDISETEIPDIIDAGRRYAEQAEDAAERAEEAAAGVDNYALAGAGKMTGYSDGVINTNVYLHREPKVGDRLLIRMTQTFTDSTPIKIYKESGGTAYTLSFDMWSDQNRLEGLCLVEIVDFLENLALRFLYSFNGASLSAGQYIGITSGGYINNTAPQLGDNSDYIEITNAADGDLGAWNYYARYALVNFKVNATPYSTTGEYVIKLARGSVLEDACLVDRDGNNYTKPIKAGTVLLCVINASTDTVTVVNDDIIANGRVLDGNGNDLQSVAALEQSASGNPIVVNAQGIDAKELSVELEPIQDLHGLPFPYVGGAYKNKLPMTVSAIKAANTNGTWSGNRYTMNNVTIDLVTDDADNVIAYKVNGTNSGLEFVFSTPFGGIATGNYYANGCADGGSDSNFDVYFWNVTTGARVKKWDGSTGSVSLYNSATSAEIQVPNTTDNLVYNIRIRAGYTANNVMFYPMIRESTESDASFAPYSNICPISGYTETSAIANGKNFVKNTFAPNRSAGLSVANNNDGSITISGTHSASSGSTIIQSWGNQLPTGSYKYSVGNTLPSNADSIMVIATRDEQSAADYITLGSGYGSEVDFTYTAEQKAAYPYVRASLNIYYTDTWGTARTYYPMIRPSGASGDYEKYKTPTTATIQLGQTVYGARINFKTGEGIVDRAIVDLGTLDYTSEAANADGQFRSAGSDTVNSMKYRNNLVCSQYKNNYNATYNTLANGEISLTNTQEYPILRVRDERYTGVDAATFKTAMSGVQLCYELATPITLTLTPSMLKLLEGYNYITADGDMQLVYIPESVLDEAKAYAKAYTDNKVPDAPTTDGTYRLTCTVTDGVPTFSWESAT